MAECNISLSHHIQFHDTSILAKKSRCIEHIIRAAIEIEIHPNNVNKEEENFSLSRSWKPLIQILRE
jgi:hypothetical protein